MTNNKRDFRSIFIAILVLLFVGGSALAVNYKWPSISSKRSTADQISVDLSGPAKPQLYSASGILLKVEDNQVTFKIPAIGKTNVYNTKIALIGSWTELRKLSDPTKLTFAPAKLEDLKPNSNVMIYTSEDVNQKDQFNALKIDILK